MIELFEWLILVGAGFVFVILYNEHESRIRQLERIK